MNIRTLALSLSIFALACSGDNNNGTNIGTQTNNGTNTKTNNKTNNKINNKTNNKTTTTGTTSIPGCEDLTTTIYTVDADGDGFAPSDSPSETKCLKVSELAAYVLTNDDCNDNDLLQFPGAEGVCGDHVVDTCDGDPPRSASCQPQDEECPETQAAGIDEPTWDCTGDAPSNVYAYATFDDGNEYFKDGSCFIFFEGFKNGFYVKHKLDRVKTDPSCDTAVGCVCPVTGSRSYDRRMYAFTSDPNENNCPEIRLQDNDCGQELIQPVSNDCRKYLDQLHPFETNSSPAPFDHPYSYVAGSVEALETRIGFFKTLEVACVNNSNQGLDWASLMTGTIQRNAGFVKK